MKTVFIIPGNFNYPNKKVYLSLRDFFESKGYKVYIFWTKWGRPLSIIHSEFLSFFDQNKGEKNILFGFSYGAMIAFKSSLSLDVEQIILCSLSPYFKEDMNKIPILFKLMALPFKKDFNDNWIFQDLLKDFSTPTLIFYGDKDNKQLIQRVMELKNAKPNLVTLVTVEGVSHNISSKKYLSTILDYLGSN